MKRYAVLLLVLCTVGLPGCGDLGPMLRETGDLMTLTLRSSETFDVELLAVQASDSALLCLAQNPPTRLTNGTKRAVVLLIPSHTLQTTTVAGYRNDQWYIGVLLTQVAPAAGMAIAAASEGENAGGVFAVFLIPAALSSMFFAVTGLPAPEYEGPPSTSDLQDMRRYARFAGEFTPEQIAVLLKNYNQTELIRVESTE